MANETPSKVLIGLEIHGYIETKEKLFCRCENFHDMKKIKPNTNICPICTGQPGAKPMLPNKTAVDKIIEIALMLNCKINLYEEGKPLIFQRKHYDWPDMPYGYQRTISGAYSVPVGENGEFLGIRIREVHLEEDPAAWNPKTGTIDYNRAGAPLVEIVTEPDFHSSEEVGRWIRNLLLTLSYIKALNKDAGIKVDININLHGISERTEIKNIHSIREVMNAIKYEIDRHRREQPKERETRRWNSELERTELMRSKEGQEDYRFIPDPDLPLLKVTSSRIEKIRSNLPESPLEKLQKIIEKYKIDKENAEILTRDLEIAELYEEVAEKIDPKFALPWITVEWLSVLNYNKITMDDVTIDPQHFIELLNLLQEEKITPLKAKDIMRQFVPSSFSPLIRAAQESKITDENQLKTIIQEVLEKNIPAVDSYKNGEKKAFNFLMGQVMQRTQKRADPQLVRKLLEQMLQSI